MIVTTQFRMRAEGALELDKTVRELKFRCLAASSLASVFSGVWLGFVCIVIVRRVVVAGVCLVTVALDDEGSQRDALATAKLAERLVPERLRVPQGQDQVLQILETELKHLAVRLFKPRAESAEGGADSE